MVQYRKIKNYFVYNGAMGNGQVAVIVSTFNETQAREVASYTFRMDKKSIELHGDRWWNDLRVEEVHFPMVVELS